jgi:outer membrane protein TolC
VQIRVLRRFIDLFAARSDSALLREAAIANSEILAMLTKRLDLGSASAAEVAAVRQRWLAGEQASSEGALREADAFIALAEALGITAAALRGTEFAFDSLEDLIHLEHQIPARSGDDLRAQALRDRADLQRLLAEYAAAEATVKLEVARQFPELSLKPGYLWDQADNRWSLALGWLVPPSLGNRPAIREAEAKRQLVAQQFMARQAAIVGEIDAALARNRLAEEALLRSRLLVETALASEVNSRRGVQVGVADRGELIASRLERLTAQRAVLSRRVALLQAHADLEAALQVSQASANPLVLQRSQTVSKAARQ